MLKDILSIFESKEVGWLHDSADRMNSVVTVYIIVLFSTLVTCKTYFMLPISCFLSTAPNGFNIMDYVTNFCWVNGTTIINHGEQMPVGDQWDNHSQKDISYYPWIPIILIIQALLFYVPKAIWKEFCVSKAGTDLESIINGSIKASGMSMTARSESIKDIAGIIEALFHLHRDHRRGLVAALRRKMSEKVPCIVWGKRSGNSVFGVYMSIKVMYIANALGQCFLMMKVLHLESVFDIVNYLVFGHQTAGSIYFPRVTYCDVQGVRSLGGLKNRYIAQCVLPINIFNEKVYVFLFIWSTFLIALNIVYCLTWVYAMSLHRVKRSFVEVYLCGRNVLKKVDKALIDKFLFEFLRLDGMFLLKMMKINAGDLITASVVEQLWTVFKTKYRNINLNNSEAGDNFQNLSLKLEPGEEKVLKTSLFKDHEMSTPKKELFF